MSRERVTSLDVAAHAGVSQSAVSRVFTPGASVSKKMADRVRSAASELGYRPNVLARSLITGRSRIIGLVVAYLDNHFYPDALQKLSAALQEKGYHILIFTADNSEGDADRVIQNLMDYQVDGIIAASVGITTGLAERCEAAGIPVVLFNRGQDDPRLAQITSDNIAGGRKVAEFLVDAGHRRIASIHGWAGATTGRDRLDGFLQGLATRSIEPVAITDGLYKHDVAAQAARDLFAASGPKPDAIFVGNDHMAFAVMDVLRHDLKLSVPGDVSVIGYDDVAMASWASYDLTTVRQPSNKMVEATVEAVLARIADPDAMPKKQTIDGPLIVRGSARTPQD